MSDEIDHSSQSSSINLSKTQSRTVRRGTCRVVDDVQASERLHFEGGERGEDGISIAVGCVRSAVREGLREDYGRGVDVCRGDHARAGGVGAVGCRVRRVGIARAGGRASLLRRRDGTGFQQQQQQRQRGEKRYSSEEVTIRRQEKDGQERIGGDAEGTYRGARGFGWRSSRSDSLVHSKRRLEHHRAALAMQRHGGVARREPDPAVDEHRELARGSVGHDRDVDRGGEGQGAERDEQRREVVPEENHDLEKAFKGLLWFC